MPFRDAGAYAKECGGCHGTGRVGGHGPAIIACQPIREVKLTDRGNWNSGKLIAWARQQAGIEAVKP